MKTIWQYPLLIILALVGLACSSQPDERVEAIESPGAPLVLASLAPVDEGAALTVPEPQQDTGEFLLLWEGRPLLADSPTDCQRLRLTAAKAFIGPCQGEEREVQLLARSAQEWGQIVARFGPFQRETAAEKLDFRGHGTVAGPAWERALTVWTQFTAAELSTGQVSEALRTVLAWNLGELPDQPGICRRLIVLAYGYATAGLTSCEGGLIQEQAVGWLETSEWDQFDRWLYSSRPVYQDDNYFDGRGPNEMSEAELAALAAWAEMIYDKLDATARASTRAGQMILVSTGRSSDTPPTTRGKEQVAILPIRPGKAPKGFQV